MASFKINKNSGNSSVALSDADNHKLTPCKMAWNGLTIMGKARDSLQLIVMGSEWQKNLTPVEA